MSDRQIAILIDGGFFLKRLPKLVPPERCDTAENIVSCIRTLCRKHIEFLTDDRSDHWHKYVYRIFFYDAAPYDGSAHHPTDNRPIDFGKSDVHKNRTELFDLLRRQRNVALRLGKVVRDGDWSVIGPASRKIIATKKLMDGLDLSAIGPANTLQLTTQQVDELKRLHTLWTGIRSSEIQLPLRQKGVDMRIGLDMASLALKKQASTIVLISGDSDFVPAAKLARREGVQIILDPMWQSVNADLFEHIDGLKSGLPNPGAGQNAANMNADNENLET